MNLDYQSEKPIYLQIAQEIEDAVFTGAFLEETQIPSTTELSMALKINPATVLKGMNLLVEEGILYKRRGLGMFVCQGAAKKVKQKRQNEFYQNYVENLLQEAKKLHLKKEELIALIERGYDDAVHCD